MREISFYELSCASGGLNWHDVGLLGGAGGFLGCNVGSYIQGGIDIKASAAIALVASVASVAADEAGRNAFSAPVYKNLASNRAGVLFGVSTLAAAVIGSSVRYSENERTHSSA